MEKNDIISSIIAICTKENFKYSKNVKSDSWKADIVVELPKYKLAFTIGKRFKNENNTYNAMKAEKVCGVWLNIDGKHVNHYRTENDLFPTFSLFENENKIDVKIDDYLSLPFNRFISLMLYGKIRKTEVLKPKAIEVCFFQEKCWKCDHLVGLYFVKNILGPDNRKYYSLDEFYFNPIVIESVRKYITQHPELKIEIGEIKERYSKTMDSSYKSFGCPSCDAIFGNFFLHDIIIDLYYETEIGIHTINVEEYGMELPITHWEITE